MDADGQGSVSFLIQGSSKLIHLTAGRVNGLWNSFEKLNLDCATGRLMKEPTRWQCPNSFPSRDCVAMIQDRIVIPNECEGSRISPCGRNDRDDVFDLVTQSLAGEGKE